MSDIDVTIQNNCIDISADFTPNLLVNVNEIGNQGALTPIINEPCFSNLSVDVSQVGTQGPAGAPGSGAVNPDLFVSKAESGQFYAASNPSGYTTQTDVNQALLNLSNYVNATFATAFDLNQTGAYLDNKINQLSGTLTQDYASKQYVIDSINSLSGNLSFINYRYTLTSGYDKYDISFPQNFLQTPRTVLAQLENNELNIIYSYDILNITSSGFSINFSDLLDQNCECSPTLKG